ncbi:uncharacterized protein FA14DRAFT_162746 [Meira miltonrushii]|uniref:Uncharacterized protein n=1 Tax=Meira miltonrushii TaxID=1280837 RepID=A0A316V1S2_9BASI|nr:uncharacterized protein FA14DRAFT_162746 [Meira miltonrushii]PWN31499.1 hypothetical protein FA14DRAFT_162746 [Meira miltonrushii]
MYNLSSSKSEDGVSGPSSSNTLSDRSSKRSNVRKTRNVPIKSIPDLRFEQSYLASIRGFIHEEDDQKARLMKSSQWNDSEVKSQIEGESKNSDSNLLDITTTRSSHGEPELWIGRLRIEWFPLLYLTLRDQLLSPIVQGAVFGMAGLAYGQFRSFLITRRNVNRQTRN